MLRFVVIALSGLFALVGLATAGAFYLFYEYGRGLPDYRELADYEPPMVTRVHGGDGRLPSREIAWWTIAVSAFGRLA